MPNKFFDLDKRSVVNEKDNSLGPVANQFTGPCFNLHFRHGMLRNAFHTLILSVVGSMVIYIGLVVIGDQELILDAVSRLSIGAWALILSLSLGNYLLRFARWHWYLSTLGCTIPIRLNLCYYLSGFAFTTSPGKVGEIVRSFYLKPLGVRYPDSLAALVAERLLDVITILILALFIAYDLYRTWWLVILIAATIFVILPLLRSPKFRNLLGRLNDCLTPSSTQSMAKHLSRLLESSASLLRSRVLYGGVGLGLLAWGAEGISFYLILQFLGASIPLLIAVGIYGLSVLAGAISLIPGGLGSTEAVMAFMLLLKAVDPPTAVAATIVCRIATLWFAVLIGVIVIVGLEINRRYAVRTLT